MLFDMLVENGTVVTAEGIEIADVAIVDGRVGGLLTPGSGAQLEARDRFDASGLHILPGVVEPHAHIGLGGPNDWESETRSAALGGVTTIFNYVMGGRSLLEMVADEHGAAGPRTHADYALHVVPSTAKQLSEMDACVTDLGITSFKFFMSFRGDEGKYLGVEGTDDGDLFEYLTQVAKHPGAVANIHAENIEIVWRLRSALMAQEKDGLPAWNLSRPDFVESEAVSRVAYLARLVGAPTYIVHTSSARTVKEAEGLRAIAAEDGPPLYLETCAHYLTHTQEAAQGVLAKANPPLRTSTDNEALWAGIASGAVQTIGSDHSARRRELKTGSVWKAPAGLPGIGLQLTILLSEGYHRRGLPLTKVVATACTNPAKIFGLYPQKGTIRVGSDADLAFVDLERSRKVGPDTFESGAGYSIYEGQTLTGWPVATMLRGQFSYRDGAVVSSPGTGRYLSRSAN